MYKIVRLHFAHFKARAGAHLSATPRAGFGSQASSAADFSLELWVNYLSECQSQRRILPAAAAFSMKIAASAIRRIMESSLT